MTHKSPDQADDRGLHHDVREWLRDAPDVVDALRAMVAIPSFPATLEQNDMLDEVAAVIGDADQIEVDRWIPDWQAVARLESPTDSQVLWSPLEGRDPRYDDTLPKLEVSVHRLSRGAGPTLMFNGHVDVVPAQDDEWTAPPFVPRVEDGRLFARGSMDMKAGLLASGLAFRYLAERWRGNGTILMAAVPEEESGGNGTLAVLERGYRPDGVVFGEPTDLEVVHRHLGIQGFSVDVAGREGGIMRRSWGLSAAPSLARAALALEALEAERTATALATGGYGDDDIPGFISFTMSAGDWMATRPGSGELRGLMGILPGETQEEAGDALRQAVLAATSGDPTPVSVSIWAGGHRGGELPRSHPLVGAFATPSDVWPVGRTTMAGTMVCDAKIVDGGGWAPGIGLGPIGGNLHSADEWVDIESIATLVELMVRGAFRYMEDASGSASPP